MSRLAPPKNSEHQRQDQVNGTAKEAAPQRGPAGPHAGILALQRSAGNRAVSDLVASGNGNTAAGGNGVPPIVQSVLNSGRGHPLDPETRTSMESRFGHDLSQVRVHTDGPAAESARAVNAQAYTVGNDVVFDAGRYDPNRAQGQFLLTHELTHVIQQNAGGFGNSVSTASAEAEANSAAQARGRVSVMSRQSKSLACSPGPLPAETPLTDKEMLQILINERGFSFSPPGKPVEDPKGVGRGVGPAAGGKMAGQSVFAIVQITDRDGKLVDRSIGVYFGGGDNHAERQALANLESKLSGRNVAGGEMIVVVDQDPCPPSRKDCAGAIQKFARRFKLRHRIRVPTRLPARPGPRAKPVKPKTAARGAQRTDFPQVGLRDFSPTKPASPAKGGGPSGGPSGGPKGVGPSPVAAPKPEITPPEQTAKLVSGGATVPKVPPSPKGGSQSPHTTSMGAVAKVIVSSENSLAKARQFTERIKGYRTAYDKYTQALEAISLIDSMGKLLAHGTTMPKEQREADQVVKDSEEAVDHAEATIEDISLFAWTAVAGEALRNEDHKSLFAIDEALMNLRHPLENSAKTLKDMADGLAGNADAMLGVMHEQFVQILMPNLKGTVSNAIAFSVFRSLEQLRGATMTAAKNYAAASERLASWATKIGQLEQSINKAGWDVSERRAVLQYQIERAKQFRCETPAGAATEEGSCKGAAVETESERQAREFMEALRHPKI